MLFFKYVLVYIIFSKLLPNNVIFKKKKNRSPAEKETLIKKIKFMRREQMGENIKSRSKDYRSKRQVYL